MEAKIKNAKNKKTFQEIFDNFRYSDSLPATAGKFLLMSLALGGIVFAGALLPGLIIACEEFSKKGQNKYTKKQLRNATYNLKKRKLIEIIQEKGDKYRVKLTSKGQKRVKEFYFENLKIKKPKKWDRQWRILIFDIPTKPKIYNQAREALRMKIKNLGFYQIQKSVWVYPYECENEILFIAELFSIQKYIEIITAKKVLHEEILKRKFNL